MNLKVPWKEEIRKERRGGGGRKEHRQGEMSHHLVKGWKDQANKLPFSERRQLIVTTFRSLI